MRKQSSYKGNNSSHKQDRKRLITIKDEQTLLPFLLKINEGQSRSSVKALLSRGQISVNGKVIRQFDEKLYPNDSVCINYGRGKVEFNNPLLKIIWEDEDLIIVNKREGLLSVSTERIKTHTAFRYINDYVKKNDPYSRIFVIQRLDRDISGIMMFAKNPRIKDEILSNWDNFIKENLYVGVVEGILDNNTGVIIGTANSTQKVTIFNEDQDSATQYRVIQSNSNYSLLELRSECGKKNQFRYHLHSIGHPIAGDNRYGAKTNPKGRLMLHARKLSFIHPVTGEKMSFETRTPEIFSSLSK